MNGQHRFFFQVLAAVGCRRRRPFTQWKSGACFLSLTRMSRRPMAKPGVTTTEGWAGKLGLDEGP